MSFPTFCWWLFGSRATTANLFYQWRSWSTLHTWSLIFHALDVYFAVHISPGEVLVHRKTRPAYSNVYLDWFLGLANAYSFQEGCVI